MTDIWDEKPAVKYNRGEDMWKNPIRVPDHECYVQEMDAWLENLKGEYEAMESQITLLKLDIEALDKENRILQNIGEIADD